MTLLEDFKTVFRRHPAGVAVVTADAGEGPVAMTVTSLSSVSVEPPLMIFSASAMSSSSATLITAESVVLHLLAEDDVELGRLASTSNVDRFADSTAWDRLPTGEPYYRGVNVRVVADVVARIPAGQATILLVRARHIVNDRDVDGKPLLYHDRGWHSLTEAGAIVG